MFFSNDNNILCSKALKINDAENVVYIKLNKYLCINKFYFVTKRKCSFNFNIIIDHDLIVLYYLGLYR